MLSIRALKIIVVSLGVLLVLGIGLLAYGVSVRLGELTAPATQADGGWETLRLREPAGTRVQGSHQAGSLLTLHLYTGNPGTDERLVVIDVASGRLVGRITVTEPR